LLRISRLAEEAEGDGISQEEAASLKITALLEEADGPHPADTYIKKTCPNIDKFPSVLPMKDLFIKSETKEDIDERKKDSDCYCLTTLVRAFVAASLSQSQINFMQVGMDSMAST